MKETSVTAENSKFEIRTERSDIKPCIFLQGKTVQIEIFGAQAARLGWIREIFEADGRLIAFRCTLVSNF
jgi:hypothetical protein